MANTLTNDERLVDDVRQRLTVLIGRLELARNELADLEARAAVVRGLTQIAEARGEAWTIARLCNEYVSARAPVLASVRLAECDRDEDAMDEVQP